MPNKYIVLGLSVIMVISVFLIFERNDIEDYDISGIVHDVRESTNGWMFYVSTPDGSDIRCFFKERPVDMGHYGVAGDPSDDGGIFFVSSMELFDRPAQV
jgi:hypothetical protein